MINKLIQLIGREAALFESFLELLEEQKRMLVDNDAEGLRRVTEVQREKLVESQLLDKERQALIEEIGRTHDVDDDLTVSRLLEFTDRDQADRLQRLKELILDLNDRITRARNTNVMLLNQSREFIARTMTMLSKINHPENTYARNGAASTDASAVIVDRRA